MVIQRSRAVQALDPDNEDALTYLEAAERSPQVGAFAESCEEAPEPLKPTSAHPAPVADATSIESTPTSFADGRYVVQRFLGRVARRRFS